MRKGLTNTDEKAAFSFVLFSTEAAVFEFRKKEEKQLVEWNCCLFFEAIRLVRVIKEAEKVPLYTHKIQFYCRRKSNQRKPSLFLVRI